MFEHMYRHTGQLNNTGKNVVVVFMQLPEDPHHALVIDTDALPDMYNESLRRIVESTEGQQAKNLSEILARRMAPDGSNQTMLQKFHSSGRLTKTPVSNVTMIPRRGVRWPLTQIISAMETQENVPEGFDDLDPETKAEVAANLKRFNVHESNMSTEISDGVSSQAASLIEMAKMLEADAQTKREQAYRMDPNLRPSVKKKAKIAAESVNNSDTTV
jgi:acetylglutamate synthase